LKNVAADIAASDKRQQCAEQRKHKLRKDLKISHRRAVNAELLPSLLALPSENLQQSELPSSSSSDP